jgi:hypothetical protein
VYPVSQTKTAHVLYLKTGAGAAIKKIVAGIHNEEQSVLHCVSDKWQLQWQFTNLPNFSYILSILKPILGAKMKCPLQLITRILTISAIDLHFRVKKKQ